MMLTLSNIIITEISVYRKRVTVIIFKVEEKRLNTHFAKFVNSTAILHGLTKYGKTHIT